MTPISSCFRQTDNSTKANQKCLVVSENQMLKGDHRNWEDSRHMEKHQTDLDKSKSLDFMVKVIRFYGLKSDLTIRLPWDDFECKHLKLSN